MTQSKTLSQTITVRVSEKEYNLIVERAKKNNMSVSGYLARCGIENQNLLITKNRNAVRQLIEMQNYLKKNHPAAWEDQQVQKGVTNVWQSLNV